MSLEAPIKQDFDLKKEIIIRGIKIIDIGYVIVIYFAIGVTLALLIDKMFGKYNQEEDDKKSLIRLFSEICFQLWISGIIIYIARNLLPEIPFPLDKVYGFDHKKVKEVTSIATFIYAFFFFQETNFMKIKRFSARLKEKMF